MPILKWFPPQGSPRTYVLYKPVSTIGRALGNDVAIAPAPALTPPTIGQTSAGRSVAEMVGPNTNATTAPQGTMVNVVGAF